MADPAALVAAKEVALAAASSAAKEALTGNISTSHIGWAEEVRELTSTNRSLQNGLGALQDAYTEFRESYNENSLQIQTLKTLGEDRLEKVSQAAAKLAELHLSTSMEVTRVAKAITSGLTQLFAKPAYSNSTEEGKQVRAIVGQFFAESMHERLGRQGLSSLTAVAKHWEATSTLQRAGDFFPTASVGELDVATTLNAPTNLEFQARVAVSAATQATFQLLPPAGQVVYSAVTGFLCSQTFQATQAAVFHRVNHTAAVPTRDLLRKAMQGQEQVDTDLIRWVQRLKVLVQLELSILVALHQVLGYLMDLPQWQDMEVPAFTAPAPALATSLQSRFQAARAKTWSFGTSYEQGTNEPAPALPVAKASALSVSASDGMRFLESQMKNKFSNYRMPKAGSPQQDWLHWFTTVENFMKMFPTPHSIVIENLTTGVAVDDVRIYGWKSRCERYDSELQPWGVPEFLAHIRQQVLSTVTTRKAAWEELQAIEHNYADLSDCIALGTKLRKLYQQIYDTTSTEVEPVSRLQCIRSMHALLNMLHTRGKWNTPVVKAWRNFTQYDPTEVFMKYVHQDKHTASDTVHLCAEFLTEMCSQLNMAHDIYTQMQGSNSSSSRSSGRHQVNNFTISRGRGRSNAGVDRSRSREPTRPTRAPNGGRTGATAGRGGRGRTDGSNRESRERSTPRDAPVGGSDAPFYTVVEHLSRAHPALAPPYLRSLSGAPAKTYAECINDIKDKGFCILCQKGKHNYNKCHLRTSHPQETDEWLQKYAESRAACRRSASA